MLRSPVFAVVSLVVRAQVMAIRPLRGTASFISQQEHCAELYQYLLLGQ